MSAPELGYVLYDGPSKLDGSPIAVIATLHSRNDKTGNMVQVWIIRTDIAPHIAAKNGMDSAICGNCPHKLVKLPGKKAKRTCYVTVHNAPLAVYNAYKRGRYPTITPFEYSRSRLAGRAVRLGAYGDMAAAPTSVTRAIVNVASMHTGYTHQQNHPTFDPELLNYVMASADTPKQADKLNSQGARTFRVMLPGDSLRDNEIECLADSQGLQCIDCGLCDGKSDKPNIAITVHGAQANSFNSNTVDLIARSA
jgi:hypothetical protein